MELLVVGAGAVGSVYGYLASQQSGPERVRITYLIKPKHRKSLEEGLRLYRWKGRRAETIEFREYKLIESLEEVAHQNFDAVLITLPSNKVREGGWLESLLKVTRSAAIWSLQPNPGDREFIREKMNHEKLVFGSIPILSYLAPMPGENFSKPGYAFYLPPTSKAAWSSAIRYEAEKAVKLFTAGGLPSKLISEGETSNLLPESLLRCVVAGLEKSGWSFERLLNGPTLSLVSKGMREMTAIYAKRAGAKDPGNTFVGKLLSTRFSIRAALRVASLSIPFNFESFLRLHFTKVEEQMHQGIDELLEIAKEHKLPATSIRLLRAPD